MIENFMAYVSNYKKNKDAVARRIEHSLRVHEMMMTFASELEFSLEEIELAGLIGLIHDIGCFDLLSSNDESIMMDHADYGVELLFQKGLINTFNVDKKYYKIIKHAIRNHNKYELELVEDENIMKFSRLLRDIDKIDILYQFSELNEDILVDNSTIKRDILDAFDKHQCVKSEMVETNNERLAVIFAFVFDINFDISLKFVKKYIEKLYERVCESSVFDDVHCKVNKYLKERDDLLC